MKNSIYLIVVFVLLAITGFTNASPFPEFSIAKGIGNQQNPDIDQKIVVFEEDSSTNWNIKAADISNTSSPVISSVASFLLDQRLPKISKDYVVWQDNSQSDWDIWITNISVLSNPVSTIVTPYSKNQSNPAIYGSNVVWQDDYFCSGNDLDIAVTSITDSDYPNFYVAASFDIESKAAIWKNIVVWQSQDSFGNWSFQIADITDARDPIDLQSKYLFNEPNVRIDNNIVVWQDNLSGNLDIYAMDISDTDNPREFAVCINASQQSNPAIDGNIIVWQDNRNGNWDIYGYNILTSQEFRITDNTADQTSPAISGNIVVWQDKRAVNMDIYGATLSGNAVIKCGQAVKGDINHDCQINHKDLAIIANNWLKNNLQ